MRLTCVWIAAVALAVSSGCGKGSKNDEAKGSKADESGDTATDTAGAGGGNGPGATVTMAFGDCAGPTARFVSGPQPHPFDIGQIEARMASMARAKHTSIDDEDLGGTGTAMTLDEGKMGKRESSRDGDAEGGGAFGTLTGTQDIGSGFGDGDDTTLLEDDTGWGTIGTGRYGTIGHGSGTGSGYGVRPGGGGMRGRKAQAPTVRIGAATVRGGDLDKDIVQRYIRRKLPRIKYCYEKELLVRPELAGTVVADFTIDAEGAVLDARASGLGDPVDTCVQGVISTIEFPKPRDGKPVKAHYPFQFSPGDSDSQAAAPVADTARGPSDPAQPAAPYVAGKDNPLRHRAEDLEACFRRQSETAFAAVVVDLTVGAGGAITAATTHGIADSAASCIAEVGRTTKWASAEPNTYRCPIAFGPMSVADAPGTDITASAITYTPHTGAAPIAAGDPQLIAANTSPQWRIEDLYIAMFAERDKRTLPASPVASITGPHIVRPVADTPMKVVNDTLMTARAAAVDPILAVSRDGVWTILPHARGPEDAQLPIAPVPLTAGRDWRMPPGIGAISGVEVEQAVRISLYVTKTDVWIGLSQVNDFRKIPREDAADDWTSVTEVLVEHHGSSFFVGRNAIEIAADDEIPYSDVVKAVDTAYAAGFTNWSVMRPTDLSARPQL